MNNAARAAKLIGALLEDEFHPDEFGQYADLAREKSKSGKADVSLPPMQSDGEIADDLLQVAERLTGLSNRVRSNPRVQALLQQALDAADEACEILDNEL